MLYSLQSSAQLVIDNATFYIGAGATVTVQGNVSSNTDIQGGGLLLLKGSALQQVNMGGHSIPNLQLDNTSNATLQNSDARIGNSLLFTNGKFTLNAYSLRLSPSATVSGQGASRFVQINGTGQLVKELTADIANYELPVGEGNNYRPALLTTNGNAYTNASVGIRVLGAPASDRPPMISSQLQTNWPVTRTGITGGSVFLSGKYLDPTDVQGTETNLRGYYFNGTDWSSAGETHDAAVNSVGVPVSGTGGVVTGMNKFIALGARAFLQGAYDPATGLMTDNLRSLPFGSSASMANFPSTDPYRVSPYSASFTHVNNTGVETIPNSGVIGAQANPADNIVDWVFLELRDLTASPGNVILQTRAALLQRDGDIVDVDGISPVTFNNVPDGNYILAVRHRNHLGLSYSQISPKLVTETASLAFDPNRVFDFRTESVARLFGNSSAYTTAAHPALITVTLLWGGNANMNGSVRYTGGGNDKDFLLVNTLGNNQFNFLNNSYHAADVNMNKTVRYSGGANDKDFILVTVLGNNQFNFRNQALPD